MLLIAGAPLEGEILLPLELRFSVPQFTIAY